MKFSGSIWLILMFTLPLAQAQGPHTLWFHTLANRQGLDQNYNWYVLKDSRGFLWASSIGGLYRFDGQVVKRYNAVANDTTSLLGENVYSGFMEDRNANLWFSTTDAVHCYVRKHDHFKRFFIKNECGEATHGDYQVCHLEQGRFLWVKIGHEIYRMDIERPYERPRKVSESSEFSYRVGLAPDGTVSKLFLYGVNTGLEVQRFDHGRHVSSERIMPENWVTDVLPRNDQLLWICTAQHGPIPWNPSSNAPLDWKFKGQFDAQTVTLAQWGNDRFFILAKGKGIFLYDEKKSSLQALDCRFIDRDPSPLLNMKNAYVDDEDNLWLIDFDNGLHFANAHKAKFRSLPKLQAPGIADNYHYWALTEDAYGQIWQATSTAGVFVTDSDGKLIQHLTHNPKNPYSLRKGRVIDLIYDARKNRIWTVTSGKLSWCSPVPPFKFHHVAVELGGAPFYLLHMHQTKAGKLMLSSEGEGLFELLEDQNGFRLAQVNGTEGQGFQTILEDTKGRLYCVSEADSICIFEQQGGAWAMRPGLPIGGIVNGLHEDPIQKTAWIATMEGLHLLDRSQPQPQLQTFTTDHGLPSNGIGEMEADNDGRIWLGTNNGLACFKGDLKQLRQFHLADGVQSESFYLTAVLKRSNGELWFGGSDGITIVPAKGDYEPLAKPPKLLLTDLKIHGEAPKRPIVCEATGATNISEIKRFSLPHTDNMIAFEFVAADYGDPAHTLLEYQLEGVETHFTTLKKGEPGVVRFSGLDFGHYTLLVRPTNSEGQSFEAVRLISFTINPPWWKTTWFYALLALVFGLSVVGVYKNQVRKVEERAERRRIEAEYKQQLSETETAVLRLQMNPHFIFNSMNSISSYILKKDIDTADRYLHRFAKLMRSILNLAAKPRISIADEVELLRLYMDTEAMRFEQKFTQEITVDEALDEEEVLIPTMILQPFVENAIWHGLSNKPGQGRVSISFAKQGNTLCCTVEDNGVGRKAAAEKKNSGHASKALPITARRLQLLAEETQQPASFDIIDLTDSLGNATGTRVEVRLPLMEG